MKVDYWCWKRKKEGRWTKTYIKIFRRYSNVNYEILNSKGISGTYTNLKAVYRWDGTDEPQTPTINPNTGEITNWKD
ncbi:hypothetical protein [Spiroplasma endosymbiont of Glossina fuscipes fuscipes]|uniref:hypothetical protein n=1 Tax=Spiroplasma endosymbiont of Glossina fuscipes fuscipes TaxID=2004463 RepID=UPI003C78EC4D